MGWINQICKLGVTAFLGGWSVAAFSVTSAFAQSNIVPDNTLGAEKSEVLPPDSRDLTKNVITGGAVRGSNLFHSFQEFNVGLGREAYFLNQSDSVQNILARVTGSNRSSILGKLGIFNGTGVTSNPNLFLINPNGIVFGKNAQLDVGGSFIATTASAIQFGEKGNFSATNPEAPGLLTIQPSAFFFSQINQTAEIINQSQAPAGVNPIGVNVTGLRVPDGKSLLLVGGNVSLDGGRLVANGGRVELTGLASPGSMGLNTTDNGFSLNIPNNLQLADISLMNEAFVSVFGAGEGDIGINARNIEMSNSQLYGGISRNLGDGTRHAGDIKLNATGAISLKNSLLENSIYGRGNAGNIYLQTPNVVSLANADIFSNVEAGGVGKGGNININAATLTLQDSTQLQTITRSASGTQPAGRGDAGNVNVKVSEEVDIAGVKNGFPSGIRSSVGQGTEGNGGNIFIDAGSFKLRDGAELTTSTFGKGNAGNVTVSAKNAVSLANADIFSNVEAGGVGKGGNIDINAATLTLQDGAQLSASTLGQGNAGNVTVSTKNAVSLANNAGIFSTVEAGGVGKGGNVNINAATLTLKDGAQLLTSTRSASDTQPAGRGDAGNVNVKVSGEVDIAGVKNGFSSSIFSSVGTGTEGNGGNIEIDAGSLKLRDGAQLSASTFRQGNAGNVTVNAKNAVSLANANIFSTVEAGGVGKGGNININAATLTLQDGAGLQTITRSASDTQPAGRGDAGNVNVKVSGEVDIAGVNKNGFPSAIFSRVDKGTEGNGGNIGIDAGSFKLRDGAELSASTSGQGNAGNVTVNAKNAVSLANNAYIFSTVEAGGVGKGGNIDINAATLTLQDGAQLQTSTRSASDTQLAGRGDAGNVNVKVSGEVDIAGVKNGYSSGIFSDVETGKKGNGGNIGIDAGSFKLRGGAQLSASTFGQGNAGNVTVNAKNAVSLANNAGIFSTVEAGGVGKGGNIDINAATLTLQDGAQLQTSTRSASGTQPAGRGDAGNVNVKVSGEVDIAGVKNGFPSGIFSRLDKGTEGNGGNIEIDAGSFKLRDGAGLTASTLGQGNAGNVTVNAKNAVSLANADIFSIVEAGGVGKGGNININAATLTLQDGAQLGTFTRSASDTQPGGRGDAGNVNVKVSGEVDIAGVNNSFSSGIYSRVQTGTEGNGGNIFIHTGSFKLRDGAVVDASTQNHNKGGNITVNANLFETLNGGQLITNTSSNGLAGKITVNATDKVIISGSDPNYNERVANFRGRIINIGANSGFFVNSTGSGITGDIEITSPKITLENQGRLNANSVSGDGGNIKLNASNLLLLRRNSQISTNAGTEEKGGNGGNININSRFVVAIPNQNNDITANAYSGKGGNINVQSQGIFGFEPRAQASDTTNDITSSSEFGLSGTINVNSPDNSSLQNSLSEFPQNFINSNALIANSCIARANRRQEGSFIITGSGALANRPSDVSVSNYATDKVRGVTRENTSRPWKKGDPIVEPQGLYRLADGRLVMSRECW
jgi:filamentous hemagglutinin family protein